MKKILHGIKSFQFDMKINNIKFSKIKSEKRGSEETSFVLIRKNALYFYSLCVFTFGIV
jgi:hypothetical protein